MLDQLLTFYTDSYGGTIHKDKQAVYKAFFSRAVAALQNKLGWQLDGESAISVLGISPVGCECDIAPDYLDPAPPQKGQYRIFNFSKKAPNVLVDPFTKVHSVYICKNEPEGKYITSANNEVIILKRITNYTPRYFLGDYGKYIQSCPDMSACSDKCSASCNECTSLLVDADWVAFPKLPQDFLFLLCDYVDWLANGGIGNASISSESVDGHSVTYGNKSLYFSPFDTPDALTIIGDFAGPFGKAGRQHFIW